MKKISTKKLVLGSFLLAMAMPLVTVLSVVQLGINPLGTVFWVLTALTLSASAMFFAITINLLKRYADESEEISLHLEHLDIPNMKRASIGL